MYADLDFYKNKYKGSIVKDEDIVKFLEDASLKIDILTYNRIRALGFENCSDFESNIIKIVNCEIADFYFKNKDDLETIINEYSINGVSVKYGITNNNIININSITLLRSTYQKLNMTRFTSLIF